MNLNAACAADVTGIHHVSNNGTKKIMPENQKRESLSEFIQRTTSELLKPVQDVAQENTQNLMNAMSISKKEEFDEPFIDSGVPEPDTSHASLTKRENEIAHYLANGYSKAAIAKQLMISTNTVKTHCRNIQAKWGMNTEDTGELQRQAKVRLFL